MRVVSCCYYVVKVGMKHAQDIRIGKQILKACATLTILSMDGGNKPNATSLSYCFLRTNLNGFVAINACWKRSLDSCDNLLMQMKGEGGSGPKFNQFANHKSPLKITRLYFGHTQILTFSLSWVLSFYVVWQGFIILTFKSRSTNMPN